LLPLFRAMPGFEEALAVLRRTTRVRGKIIEHRYQAIDALAAARDIEWLPKLVELLGEPGDPDLVRHVHRALVALTGTDEGTSPRRWTSWLKKNRARHRIEWLIDALTNTDEAVRAAAGEELKRISQE